MTAANVRVAESGRRRVAMNAVSEVMPASSPVSRTPLSQRFFAVCYFTVITVATVGWVSAFGWVAVKVVEWLIA
jgi:hypothetical protein